jgi:hypothetical protein
MKTILKNLKTGLFFAEGHHFTVGKTTATPLNSVQAALVRASYVPEFIMEIPYSAPRVATDAEFFGRSRNPHRKSRRQRRAERIKSYLLGL